MGRPKGTVDLQDTTARDLLLASALKLFNQKGYASTTVREIVADAGVTKPVLYYYFGNKEGIYLELFERPLGEFDALLKDFSCEGGRASEKLRALFGATFQLYCNNLDKVRLLNKIYYGPPQGTPYINFEGYHSKLVDAIGKIVDEGIEKGEFRALDTQDMILAIVGAFHVAMDMMLCQTPGIAIKEDVPSRVLTIIFQGILRKE